MRDQDEPVQRNGEVYRVYAHEDGFARVFSVTLKSVRRVAT